MAKARHRSAILAFAAALGVAAPVTLYAASLRYLDPADTPADAMPAYEIVTRVREMALDPASAPVRRGSYYVMDAYDRRGVELRVVADAQNGDILSVSPARALAATVPLGAVPRIIHVPEPYDDRPTADESDAAPPDDPHDVTPPRRRPFSSTRKAARQRAVLTAPPPQASADALTPIYPTPKFSREDQAQKFTAPPPVSRDDIPSQ